MDKYCGGGMAMADGGEVDSDHETLMDHTALEMMHAMENKDHETFRNGFHVLVAHTLNQMQPDEEEGE